MDNRPHFHQPFSLTCLIILIVAIIFVIAILVLLGPAMGQVPIYPIKNL